MYEYRWLLFDSNERAAYLSSDYDRNCDGVRCYGLYRFPSGTIYPSVSLFSGFPDLSIVDLSVMAVNALRSWVERHCVPVCLLQDSSDEIIRTAAYYAWINEGKPENKHLEHWKAAEEAGQHLFTSYSYPVATLEDPEVDNGAYEKNQNSVEHGPQLEQAEQGGSRGGSGIIATLATIFSRAKSRRSCKSNASCQGQKESSQKD